MSILDKIFKRPEKYTDVKEETPAMRAARKWDEREGEVVVQNYHLRIIALGLMVTIILLAGALIYKSLSSSVMPYVVEVDTTTGAIRNVGTVESSRNYKPTDAVYRYFLAKFLKNTREVPLDPIVYRENLSDAYAFLTKSSARKMQSMLESEKISEKFGTQTVQINISTILPMEGGHSYQIRWTEEIFEIESGLKIVTPYSGIFTVQTINAEEEEQLNVNPINLYITDFSWSKDASALNTESKTKVNNQ